MKTTLTILFLLMAIVLKSQQFSVMSYNIRCGNCDDANSNNWESRKEMLLSVIKKQNPTILALQEAIPLQLSFLKANLPEYAYFGTGRNADGTGEGCHVLYKKDKLSIDSVHSATKWFSSTPDIPGTNDMGDSFNRIVTFVRFKATKTNQNFYLFNTHLTYLDSIQVRYIDFLSGVIKNRKTPDPFILVGDLNADESSPAIQKLLHNFRSEKLVDTYRKIHPTGKVSTFNFFNGKSDGRKIDYVFVQDEKFKTIDAGCDTTSINGKFPSDHNAIYATIELR